MRKKKYIKLGLELAMGIAGAALLWKAVGFMAVAGMFLLAYSHNIGKHWPADPADDLRDHVMDMLRDKAK